jgi:hypothetical protein
VERDLVAGYRAGTLNWNAARLGPTTAALGGAEGYHAKVATELADATAAEAAPEMGQS